MLLCFCLRTISTESHANRTQSPYQIHEGTRPQLNTIIYMSHFQYDPNIISSMLHLRKCVIQYTESPARFRDIVGLYLDPERVTRCFSWVSSIASGKLRDSTSNWPMSTPLHVLSNFYLESFYSSTPYSLRCSQHYDVIHKQTPSFTQRSACTISCCMRSGSPLLHACSFDE
jgi:hypothetical protein